MSQSVIELMEYESESRRFAFNFADYAELVAGESISAATVTATPSGLTIGSPTIYRSRVQVQLSGGTAGVTYRLRCQITTSGSSTLIMLGDLRIEED